MAGMMVSSPPAASAEDRPAWQYGLAFSYLTGDYGADENTDILYGAAVLKRFFPRGDVTATIPWLDVSGGGVTLIDGGAEPIAGAAGGSGLGDIVLKGRYYAVQQSGPLPFIDLVASLKLPTASEAKGLGTGKQDFTLAAEFARVLPGNRWIVLGELGHTFVGDPSGYDASNRWLYNLGLACRTSPRTMLSGYLEGRTAVFAGNDDPLSLLLGGEFKLTPGLYLDTMVETGLNDGAPDLGVTIAIRKRI